jgi:hypothetical protein
MNASTSLASRAVLAVLLLIGFQANVTVLGGLTPEDLPRSAADLKALGQRLRAPDGKAADGAGASVRRWAVASPWKSFRQLQTWLNSLSHLRSSWPRAGTDPFPERKTRLHLRAGRWFHEGVAGEENAMLTVGTPAHDAKTHLYASRAEATGVRAARGVPAKRSAIVDNRNLGCTPSFTQPYSKIQFLVDAGIAQRQTASEYLQELEKLGILKGEKRGREVLYKHPALLKVLTA